MIRVRDWSGEEHAFDERRTARWAVKNLRLPKPLAREVARRVSAEVGPGVVEARDLVVATSRISLRLMGERFGGLSLAAPALARLPAASLLPVAAVAPVDVIGPTLTGLQALSGLLEKGGWESDYPDGWKKESGGAVLLFDDANAPSIGLVTTTGIACCESPRGYQVTLEVPVSDDDPDTPGNDSGVRTVLVTAMHPDHPEIPTDDGAARVELTDEQNEASQDGTVEVEVTICVPCAFARNDKAVIGIRITDDDDNERFVLRAIDLSGAPANCCGGGGAGGGTGGTGGAGSGG